MKRFPLKPLVIFGLAFLLLFSFTPRGSQKLQNMLVFFLQSFWTSTQKQPSKEEETLLRLQAENWHLKNKLLDMKQESTATALLPAKVIFRSPLEWNSCCWINVGEVQHVVKNSPVIVGDSLVGIVEAVEKKRSRVRLITDYSLTPSVRAYRLLDGKELFLAKGELHGSLQSHFRRRGTTLLGEGFNYDYEDDQGPAQSLRTGLHDKNNPALIKVGDLLLTTGMDGLFPANIKVATVTKIEPLQEGDYTYTIEAIPTAKNMEELSLVFVMPPID